MSFLEGYKGGKVYLPTLHKKGDLLNSAFNDRLQMNVFELSVDTDSVGTFSGEIKRSRTVHETLLKKIALAREISDGDFYVASEGSIGSDPIIPFFNSDIEELLFFDVKNNLLISERIRSFDIVIATAIYNKDFKLNSFLERADFPNHKLIIRSQTDPIGVIGKGIGSVETLHALLKQAVQDGLDDLVIESDFRAHCSPSRAKNIRECAQKLVERISSLCPDCERPGWGQVSTIKGLPCSECGEFKEAAVRALLFGCVACEFTAQGEDLATSIDPGQCDWCNP